MHLIYPEKYREILNNAARVSIKNNVSPSMTGAYDKS
jgi:hypothetical protein